MATVVAFLRAINVAGRFIRMAELAAHFEALELQDVGTYINSGNVLFTTRARNLAALAASIERGLEPRLGFRSEVFLRTTAEVQAIARTAASHHARLPTGGEVNVAFLAASLSPEQSAALEASRTDIDDFVHGEREVYWLCRGNQMDSRFSNAVMERRLRLRCTFRRVSMLARLSEQLRAATPRPPARASR